MLLPYTTFFTGHGGERAYGVVSMCIGTSSGASALFDFPGSAGPGCRSHPESPVVARERHRGSHLQGTLSTGGAEPWVGKSQHFNLGKVITGDTVQQQVGPLHQVSQAGLKWAWVTQATRPLCTSEGPWPHGVIAQWM